MPVLTEDKQSVPDGLYDRNYLRGVALTTAMFSLPSLSVGLAWLIFLSPLPVIYFPITQGFDKGFKIILHATLLAVAIALVAGTVPVLLLSLSLMPAGFFLARGLNRKQSVHNALVNGAIALGLTWLLAGMAISSLNQINLYQEILRQIDAGLSGALAAYSKTPDIPLDTQVELQAAFTQLRAVTPKIFPGMLATMTIGTVWLNILLANWLLKKTGGTDWADLNQWQLPYPMVWLFIAAGIMLFIPGDMNTVGLNLMMVMVTLYFMQGFAVMNFLCVKWSVPNAFRGLIIFFLVIQAFGFVLLTLLGLADIWADFRKPKTIETE